MSSEPFFKISKNIDTILSDIEGTTTSISFVKVFKSNRYIIPKKKSLKYYFF